MEAFIVYENNMNLTKECLTGTLPPSSYSECRLEEKGEIQRKRKRRKEDVSFRGRGKVELDPRGD
jgi:hypothetical protein